MAEWICEWVIDERHVPGRNEHGFIFIEAEDDDAAWDQMVDLLWPDTSFDLWCWLVTGNRKMSQDLMLEWLQETREEEEVVAWLNSL